MRAKHIMISLTLCLSMLLLAACGTKQESVAQSAQKTDAAVEEPAEDETEETAEEPDVEPTEEPDEAVSEEPAEEPAEEPDREPVQNAPLMSVKAPDLDGNEVELGQLISQNDVTLINVWGTFCPPCIQEMPDLAALYEKYNDQGFGIVGLTIDVLDENDQLIASLVSDGKDIISETGVTYPVVGETSELMDMYPTDAVPLSFFVDRGGNVIGESFLGSRPYDEWDKIIKEKLESVK